MKIGEAERYLGDQLKTIYDEGEASTITAMILENITSLSRSQLASNRDTQLLTDQERQFNEFIPRLLQHEPVQYILGKTWFQGMELFVNKSVLIPRPETEELVQWVLKDVQAAGINVFDKKHSEADETTKLKILDVGTGSGCIALALKKAMPKAEVWGCDVSEEALNVARRNGSALDIRVDFQGMDFLDIEQQKLLPTTDIIVSNPPYVPLNNKEQMHKNVVDYEPYAALFVPDNKTLIFYEALSQFGKKRLYNNGSMYMEIHEDLGQDVLELFRKEGYSNVELKKDMQGKNRMVRVKM